MTTSPEKYYARPSIGILLPGSSCDVKGAEERFFVFGSLKLFSCYVA